MNSHFVGRQFCPGCESKSRNALYKMGYSERPLRDYLDSLYGMKGRIEHQFLAGANFILCECKDCELTYQVEVPNESLMFKLYEEWPSCEDSLDRHRKAKGVDYNKKFVKEIINVIEYSKKNPADLKFLDFGSGWGNWAHLALGFNCDVYGAELSQSKIEHAKASGLRMIEWDDIPNAQLDFINTEQVLEHLSEPLQTLFHLKHGLSPNGILKISVPNGQYIKGAMETWDWSVDRFYVAVVRSRASLLPVAPLQHLNCFNHNSLVKMANRAGLEPITIPASTNFRQQRRPSLKSRFKKLLSTCYSTLSRNNLQKKATKGLCLYFVRAR